MNAKVRKITKFASCSKHEGLWQGMTRRRRAEFYMEGGPAGPPYGGPCRDGLCQLWPGTDLFTASICASEYKMPWTGVA